MLGFLRRKDKRARNAAAAAAERGNPIPSASPLRDRNAPSPAIPRHRTQLGRQNNYAKENAAMEDNPYSSNKPETRRKMHPQGRTPASAAAAAIAAAPPPNKTKPRRPRLPKRHEPAFNNKTVINDRRRSFKAPVEPVQAAPRASPSKPHHRRRPSGEKIPPPNETAYPHHDLANALRRDDMPLADSAVKRILGKSKDTDAKLSMIREGVAISLINLLKHERANLSMRRTVTASLAEFAYLDACERPLVAAGTVPVLVWLINPSNNSDRITLASACRALRNLLGGSEPTAVQAAKYGCVEPLLHLIDGRSGRPEEADVVPEATAALTNLAHHGYRFQSYVIKHMGLKSLNNLGARTTNEESLYHIVNVLSEFAKTSKWHSAIIAAGGLNTAFRALSIAQDVEVVAEAARLVGNVAVTKKARSAVREAGGASALLAYLKRMGTYEKENPAIDICCAIYNICADPKAASDALMQSDAANILLQVYSSPSANASLVRKASSALCVLADGSSNRRARVLYAIGNEIRQSASRPTDRLYDLRQAILEVEAQNQAGHHAMPETLERLSRASVRLINSGVAPHGRSGPPPSTKPPRNNAHVERQPQARPRSPHQPQHQYPERPEYALAKGERAKFRSTGRVLSVARPGAGRKAAPSKQNEDDYVIPRANEQNISDAAVNRAQLLEREVDGGYAKDVFEIGQVLGKGGYGSVFMAKDLRTNNLVAIKQFHQNGALVDKKAVKEQNIWRGLHHQNVVEFKGSFVGDNGSLNLVVEYVDGLSLADHLSQYSAFPETLVAEIARQVLQGLHYLHANGVTHRDLKPANILVDHKASVKICDFGVSRSENVQTINPGQQHMVGTPWYIAPEMIEYRPYTTSVDIWSLGCTVLELATGRRPYHELSAMQVLFRMVEDRSPPMPSHLSAECTSFLKACWVWDPEERPSAATLLKHPFILLARQFSSSSKKSSSTTTA